MRASSDDARENGRRFHRVGVALFAIARVLVGLHLASEVAPFVHADGGRDRIRKNGRDQFLGAIVPFDFKELGELRLVQCIGYLLLLATGARGFGRRSARRRVVYGSRCGIMVLMTRDQVKEILDRVLAWPTDDQEKVVRFVREVEERRADDDITDEEWEIIEARAARRELATNEEVEQVFGRYRSA